MAKFIALEHFVAKETNGSIFHGSVATAKGSSVKDVEVVQSRETIKTRPQKNCV